ncbi:MAG: hypothetical protein ACFFCH_03640 [Promethearchaeota archaeon]
MKRWFSRFVLFAGLYDLILGIIFLLGSPLISILLNYPLTILSAALLQIIAAFLVGFGIALILTSRNLEHYLLIPVANIPARLIAFIVVVYYVVIGLPITLLWLGIIEGTIGIVLALFILRIPDYSFRSVLTNPSTQPY